jgi:hypothetical protein
MTSLPKDCLDLRMPEHSDLLVCHGALDTVRIVAESIVFLFFSFSFGDGTKKMSIEVRDGGSCEMGCAEGLEICLRKLLGNYACLEFVS